MANRPRSNPAPIDPDVKIPRAVAAAAAAADAHFQQPPAATPEPQDTLQIAPEPAPPPPAATPEPQPPATPPATVPAVTQPGNERFGPVESATAEEWRARFISENGRFRASRRAIEQHEQTIQGMQNIIDGMREQLNAATAAPARATPSSLVTDKEKEDFGVEMLDVVGRRALEVITPEVAELRQQVADMAKQLQGTGQKVEKDARERLMSSLAQAVPNWEDVNFSKEFKSWLALPDVYSGVIRQKLLNTAFEQNNAPQVIAFFKGFLSEEAAMDPLTPPTPASPAPQQPTKPTLESFAAPGRARTPASGSPLPVEKPIITTSQIAAFYNLVRANHYAGKEDEKDALEREIFAAQREGRVRTG